MNVQLEGDQTGENTHHFSLERPSLNDLLCLSPLWDSEYAWGVLDASIVTDFPDWRIKTVIATPVGAVAVRGFSFSRIVFIHWLTS